MIHLPFAWAICQGDGCSPEQPAGPKLHTKGGGGGVGVGWCLSACQHTSGCDCGKTPTLQLTCDIEMPTVRYFLPISFHCYNSVHMVRSQSYCIPVDTVPK